MNRNPPTSTSNQAPAPQPNILQLPQRPGSACAASQNEHFGKTRLSCSPAFDDILYVPNEDPGGKNGDDKAAFWLLPASIANLIREKAEQLNALVRPGMPAQQRKQGLDASGLLDYFLEPRLSQFLVGEQKARMQAFEAQEPRMRETYQAQWARTRLDPRSVAREHNHPVDAHIQRLKEWKALSDLAIFRATEQGYTYREGQLFTAQAEAVRKAVEVYNRARMRMLEEFDSLAEVLEEVGQRLRETIPRYEEAMSCTASYRACRGEMIGFLLWQDGYKSRFNYVESILDIARYGLAVPEYALIDDPQAGVVAGVDRFKQYVTLLERRKAVEDALRQKHRDWVEASGTNIPPPAGLLDAERAQWQELDAQMQTLYQQAVERTAQSRLHLLWHPEYFAPDPVERLVKTGFPLREVSLPGTPNGPLVHLSLDMLKGLPASSTGKAAQDHATSDFHDWLVENGALRIDAQGEWFDKEGWFDGEAFHRYLQAQRYQVKSLASAQARQAWSERLLQLLFKKDVQRLRLFDASPSAALVRCLTPPQEDLHLSASVKGPALTHEGAGASVELSMDVNLARGEVEILKLDLPERGQARELSLPYTLAGDPTARGLNLGRFSLHLSARAWGFAGASLLLAAKVNIGPGNLRLGATLDPIEPALRTPGTVSTADNASSHEVIGGAAAKVKIENGAQASFNLFAGVQAGIITTGALNWAPPRAQATLLQVPNMPGQAIPDAGWLSLARLETSLAGALGGGGRGEINLSVYEGCLILRINAAMVLGAGAQGSLSFAVGYQGLEDLLNIVRRELHNNQQRTIQWVDPAAMAFLASLNMLAAMGIDVGMAYLCRFINLHINSGLAIMDFVMSLKDAIFSKGRGGLIAHSIMTYKNPAELERWFVECIPQGLGPMLMTLISTPAAFEVTEFIKTPKGEEKRTTAYSKEQSHLFQQQATEQVLGWIVNNAGANPEALLNAQKQFDQACSRMNKFGSYDHQGQVYCTNRHRMDRFMKEVPGGDYADLPENISMRKKYFDHIKILGSLRDDYCKEANLSDYYGLNYLPGKTGVYTGPEN